MARSVLFVLLWVGACGSQPAIAPAPAPPRPAEPARTQPAATLFGQVVDGTYRRQARFELTTDTTYGWRIKLPCTGPTLFRETLRLPAPGDWGVDETTKVSADRRSGVTEDYSGCYDGWIQHAWKSAPNDPPGEYVVTVEVDGYEPQTFHGRFVPAEGGNGE